MDWSWWKPAQFHINRVKIHALLRIWLVYLDQFELPSLLIALCIFMLTMFSSNLHSCEYFIQSLCKAGPKPLPITFCYFIILQMNMPWMTSQSPSRNWVDHSAGYISVRFCFAFKYRLSLFFKVLYEWMSTCKCLIQFVKCGRMKRNHAVVQVYKHSMKFGSSCWERFWLEIQRCAWIWVTLGVTGLNSAFWSYLDEGEGIKNLTLPILGMIC